MYSTKQMDESSFKEVFQYYYSGLYVYARRFVTREDVAADIVQDVFINLWEVRDAIDYATLKSYLFTSVRNRSISHLRHLKVRTKYQKKVLETKELPGSLTWEYFVSSELRSHLQSAVEKLTPQQRRVFKLTLNEGKSAMEIAEELQISSRTVEKHLELARKSLRVKLADYLPLLFAAGIFIDH